MSILDEAKDVRKDRAARVDDPEGNFARIAKIWEVVFGHEVTTRQVSLCMIGLKLARECYKPWRDNLVDLCGYADCLAEIEGYYAKPEAAAEAQHPAVWTAGTFREAGRRDDAIDARAECPKPGVSYGASGSGDRPGYAGGLRLDSGP